MTVFNQSPGSQATLNIGIASIGIGLGSSDRTLSINVVNSGYTKTQFPLAPGGANAEIAVGGGGSQLPTTGQIWPLGIYYS